MQEEIKNRRAGIAAAIGACCMWGVLPLYWKLLQSVPADEILAQRMVWSFVFMLCVLLGLGRWPAFCADCRALWRDRKRGALMLLASLLISMNWLTYIWAVNHDHIIETSIGYYINPLMSVLLGMVVFHERLVFGKKLSILLAGLGILIMTWQFGQLPWIAVLLATSFAVYGAVKKLLRLSPVTSITIETMLMLPASFAYMAYLMKTGQSHFGNEALVTWCIVGTGAVTATPLILFSQGANLLPLNVLGFCQYIAPTIALGIGIFVFHEPFSWTHGIAFGFIWAALILFSISEKIAALPGKKSCCR
jgi:chloramphenicol-sensitive protein RarD